MTTDVRSSILKFADFEIDCRSQELRRAGRRLQIQQQPLQILAILAGADGEVVTRDELRKRVWGHDTHVDFDRAINKAINQVRRLLGDCADHPTFIETLPKRGYRFLPGVVAIAQRAQTLDSDIHDALLKARHFGSKRTVADLTRSVEYFERALARDPSCAPAWAGLAEALVLVGLFGLRRPGDAFRAADHAVERALALDNRSAQAHTVRGDIHKFHHWDWRAAEDAYREAIAIDGGCAVAHHWYAQLLSILGRHQEACAEIEKARTCDPLSIPINAFTSYVWLEARQYERALASAQEALELDAHAPLTHFVLGRAYVKTGHPRKAVKSLQAAVRLAGNIPLIEANRAFAYARAGMRATAERIRHKLTSGPLAAIASPIDVALASLGLGDTAAALAELEEAYRSRAARIIVIGDPFFSELATEPRYQRLMTLLDLPLQG
jgi:DNA-binding winged helix-turn-helix (wHTH) protein